MTQQVGGTASTRLSSRLNPGANRRLTQTPGEDIANFAYITSQTVRRKPLIIKPVSEPAIVLHNRKGRWLAIIIQPGGTACIINSCALTLNRNEAMQKKEMRENLENREEKCKRHRSDKMKNGKMKNTWDCRNLWEIESLHAAVITANRQSVKPSRDPKVVNLLDWYLQCAILRPQCC